MTPDEWPGPLASLTKDRLDLDRETQDRFAIRLGTTGRILGPCDRSLSRFGSWRMRRVLADAAPELLCPGDDRIREPVLLAGDPGCQAQGRDAGALRPLRRCRGEGRGQLRPPGVAPRAARECPGGDA